MMSVTVICSPKRTAAMTTPKNGFRKWKVAALVLPIRPTSANQISVAATTNDGRTKEVELIVPIKEK